MREKPIIFSGEMVRAILEGRKSQTRRVIKPQPVSNESGGALVPLRPSCPYGYLGDRLWVREGTIVHGCIREQLVGYVAEGCRITEGWMKVMPSNHMRRIHSRITLEITNVRVQRLQDISFDDLEAEGYECKLNFCEDWDSINARKYPWLSNPWVWAISFRRVGK